MISLDATPANKQLYYRLVALWVVCEAFLGGIIHGLKLPVSGLIVGSCAVICISFIGYYFPSKGAVLKATIIVAVCKMMLSPQSPPPAYIAVFLQGLLGQLFFRNPRFFKPSCILLGVIALVESALQRIIVLVIIYGKQFWNAFNEFITKLTGETTVTNYSMLLAAAYVLLHLIVGIAVGWFSAVLIKRSEHWRLHDDLMIGTASTQELISNKPTQKKKGVRIIFLFTWLILIGLLLQSYFHWGRPILPSNIVLQIFIRAITIIFTWYFLISPLLTKLMKKWLDSKKATNNSEIYEVLLILPSVQNIVIKSWKLSSGNNIFRRLMNCVKIIVVNTLHGQQH